MKDVLAKHGFTQDPDGLYRRKAIVQLAVAVRDGSATVLHEGQWRAAEVFARFVSAADLDVWIHLTDGGRV